VINDSPPNLPHIEDLPPKPPAHIWTQLKNRPITAVINHKKRLTRDPLNILKQYHSYLCTWLHHSGITYAKWVPQSYLYTHPPHNYPLLRQYYHSRQTKHFTELTNKYFNKTQNQDTRFIHPPIQLPLVNISTTECNPENDILTTGHTIQVLHNSAYLYDIDGRHLHTTSLTRLQWLWSQYQQSTTHLPLLEPPLQTFETEIIWLFYRYIHPKNTQYSLPIPMLDHLKTTFNITQNYFSSPLTCPTLLRQFYSPFHRDCIFGSLGTAFSHKWKGKGFAPPPPSFLPQAIHMACLAAKADPLSYTILIHTDPS
jgi:hypothetical protein